MSPPTDTRAGLSPSRSLPCLCRTRDAWRKVRTRPDSRPGWSAAGDRSRFRIDTRNCMKRLPGSGYLRNVSDVAAVTGCPDPDLIQTAADFGRALQALRDQSGLKIREVARLTGGQRSTVGGYFSGQHLPLDRELLTRLLTVCGESDPAQIERWQLALIRVRRRPRRRSAAPYRGLARYEEADAQWFFGREDVTDLLASLATAPLELPLLLIGPSGAGNDRVSGTHRTRRWATQKTRILAGGSGSAP